MPDTNQIIGATIKVDTGNSNANVQTLNKNLTDVKSNLKDVGATATGTGKAIEDTGGRFGKLKEGLAGLPGGLGEASEGASKLNAQFLKLLANPVVLIIAAIIAVLALLYKAFTNTFEGGEKMEQIFAGIKAAGQALLDNITKIAGAIVKLFKFDFSGAIADIKGVANAVGDAYNKMAGLTKRAQELHKEQLANDLDQAKRAKDLAILREQATDESIPTQKRLAALQALQKAAKEDAEKDIALAKQVTDNKIAQLKLEQDGEKKNRDEINKLNIDQINVETGNANEQRRIGKQIAAAKKQQRAEEKAEADKAAEEAKKRREELVEYTNKLSKLQQENELATITDTYEKEKKQIENKIADEKRANDVSLQEKKITRAQFDTLNAELDKSSNLQLDALRDKHNKDVADKEAAFQKELNTILGKIKIDGITDQRQSERVQLQITYEQQLADASKAYKDNAAHLQQIREALAVQYRAEQQKLEEKFRKEDEKKATDAQIAHLKKVADDNKLQFSERYKAINDEQVVFKKQFDDKLITEQDYNDKVAALSDARIRIKEEEKAHNEQVTSAIAQTFGSLSELAGKQTVLGKTFAIIQTTIDTYQSAIKSYNSLAGIPVIGPALGAVAAAAAIASGIKAVKAITSVQVPGQGSGGTGASPSSVAPAAPVTPAQASTTFTGTQNSTAGSSSGNRAYVLESDVRNAAERNAQLNRAARLGGG